MSKATEAQLDAAYAAYYSAVNDWNVTKMGNAYVVAKRPPNRPVVEKNETTNWRFEDKETADRFLITKLLEEIANAVVSA